MKSQEFIHCWWNVNRTATLEDSLIVCYQTKHIFTVQSSDCTACYLLKEAENSHMNVYGSFIQNWQNVETNKMSFNKWKCKQTGAEIKKKWAIKPWQKGKNLTSLLLSEVSEIWKGYMLYDSSCVIFWKR